MKLGFLNGNLVNIIKLELSDLQKICELQSKSYPKEVHDSKKELKKYLNWEISHGIKINDSLEAIVFGSVNKNLLHIYSIEVSKEYQNLGIGSLLMNFCLNYAKNNNLNKIRAYAFSDNGKKILLKYGFIKNKEKKICKYVMDVMYLTI